MENPPQNQRYGKEQLDEEQLQLLPRSFVPPWKSKGKTLAGESGNKKTIGVRIASQDVLQTNGMILEDAPKDLNVVDEVGFSQLDFDTLSSDQTSAVTVDTNSVVVMVIPPPQFSRTAQLGYEDEDFGIDELEEVEICLERRENDGMSLEDFANNLDGISLDDFEKDLDEISLGDFAKDLDGISLGDFAKDLDEVGPPLNSNTLPSDQASAIIVDTNSVVGKEIPPLQFSPTAQLKNSDEDFGIEEGEIQAERTEEGGIPEVQVDSMCSAKRKRKAKTPIGERRDKKTTGKHLKGGASRNTRGGLAKPNVNINTVDGQASSKKRSTSFIGKGGTKIENSCLTELTSGNEGELLDRTFRSSLRGIMTLIKELNLRTCHKEVLKRTPFWGMFEAIIENKLSPTQCRHRGKMIIEIINTYDPVTRKFRLGREYIELTRADMVSIFGISCGKEFVSLKYGCKEDVKLVARREISKSRLTSKSLKQLLKKYVGSDEKDDVEDVARLLCVYLCHTFFFPTGSTVKWVYLECIEDLDRLRDYDWNEAIINELMSSIRKHHREPWKVTGCVMALLYWLCEHTNLSKANHPEHPLGIVKWNIPLVVSRLKEIRLKDLKLGQVVSRQANVAGTVDDEVPADKDIVQDLVSSGDVPVSNRGNNACLGNGKWGENIPGGERDAAPLVEVSNAEEEDEEEESDSPEEEKTPPKKTKRLAKPKDGNATQKSMKKKLQTQEKFGETSDIVAASSGTDLPPKKSSQIGDKRTTSLGIGLPSQQHLDVPIPSKESLGALAVNPLMAISPASIQPEMLKGSNISEAVTSKVTLDSKLLLQKLRQAIGKKENIAALVSTSATFSEGTQNLPPLDDTTMAKADLKMAMSFNFETIIQPELLDRLKNALTLLSSSENAKNLPQERIKQFNANLPSHLQTYTSNVNAIEMVKGKQERFKELGVQLTEAVEKVENFQNERTRVIAQKEEANSKIQNLQKQIKDLQHQVSQIQGERVVFDQNLAQTKQAKDNMTAEIAPLYEEYYGLDQEIPTLDGKLEALVSNLSTSTSAWDKFKAEIMDKM